MWKMDPDAIIPYFELMDGKRLREVGIRRIDEGVNQMLVAGTEAHAAIDRLLCPLLADPPADVRMLQGRERIAYNNMKALLMARFAKAG